MSRPTTIATTDGGSTQKPITYAMWATRNEARPATKRSDGSIKSTSPASEKTSAATNHQRRASSPVSTVAAAATSAAVAAGLHTYSSAVRSVAIASQSPTAATAKTASAIADAVVMSRTLPRDPTV